MYVYLFITCNRGKVVRIFVQSGCFSFCTNPHMQARSPSTCRVLVVKFRLCSPHLLHYGSRDATLIYVGKTSIG